MRRSLSILFLVVAVASCRPAEAPHTPSPGPGQETLVDMVGERPLLPRLGGGFSWAACDPSPPAEARCRPAPHPSVEEIATFSRRLGDDPSASSRAHARGLRSLLLDPSAPGLDRAVRELEEAARHEERSPLDAVLSNDLAAARLVRGLESDAPGDLVAALEAAERALEISPRMPEALYNRGLILEALHLWSAAADAWDAFARRDPESPWAREAVLRCSRLASLAGLAGREERVGELLRTAEAGDAALGQWVERDPHVARLHVERDVFAAWARSRLEGDDEAAAAARKLGRRLSAALARAGGDHLDADAWRAVDVAIEKAEDDPRALQALERGHAAFAEGMELYDGFDFAPARDRLTEAARLLRAGGSPFSGWASFYAAVCLYYRPDYPAVLAELADLRFRSDLHRHPNLAGRIAWIEGLVRLITGDFGRSLAAYERALGLFQSTGESQHVAYLHSLIAKNLRFSGAGRRSWRHHLHALEGRRHLDDRGRVFAIVLSAGEQAEADGNLRSALYFMDAQVRAAEALGQPYVTAQAFLRRSRLRTRVGRLDAARADEARAEVLLESILDPDNRVSARVDLLVTQGLSRLATDPAEAARRIGEARDHYRAVADRIDLLATYPLIAEALRARGRTRDAVEELAAAIALVEEMREELVDPTRRASFLESARAVFDSMIELQAEDLGDPAAALGFVDRSRHRLLLERLAEPLLDEPVDAPARRVSDLAAADQAVLVYRLTARRVLAWVLHGGEIESLNLAASPGEVEEIAESFRRGLHAGVPASALRHDAERLGERLLPRDAILPRPGRLVVVGDRALAGIPWSALVHPATGRHLVEDWQVTTAPSLAVISRLLRSPPASRENGREVLVVADPSFDRELYPELERLSAAREEGHSVADAYAGASLLAGTDATRGAFLEALARHGVVHFAGHALADPVSGSGRGLLFAAGSPAGNEGSVLSPEAIRRLDLAHLELAVLAACETSAGYYPESEEVASLAAAFLAAGTPNVVSALWKIDDEVARRLAVAFHGSFARDGDAGAALRHAQLALLEDGGSPARWGVLELTGLGSVPEGAGGG